ncbi:TetR/AcrR family transcriptional regulator [Phenylobacterium sp. LH3H17]|uniref:TetR/AcrR family transcriptional regulator n=1 Tax=Phenylobacterium sp. LH3H17 TaxID=2903901 RepID=UPI0020C9AE7A|nr:TetR/AcrR family transcriptional regulator [Phenylobacterium sp. LH3H17]UTP38204.1 TetR/AcrR family transcriptional regulator [Phenylobacterium sp. LH3H17]
MAAPKGGTRERILDAAERLFAEHGFEGASTRDIVGKSGDTIGSVNYHFGSKGELLGEVIRRRWDVIYAARREAYETAKTQSEGPPSIEAVVACIVIPYLERAMTGTKGWRSYALLQARILYSPKAYDEMLRVLSEPTAREFLGWMQAALPHARLEDIGYGYQFMVGSMVECCAEMGLGRIDRLTDGVCSSKNYEAISKRLVRFIASGISAICEPDDAA